MYSTLTHQASYAWLQAPPGAIVANYFRDNQPLWDWIGGLLHRTDYTANFINWSKPITREARDPRGELTTTALLNGHVVKLS